jgi:N5-(carboxyethyl)ornithine synthase
MYEGLKIYGMNLYKKNKIKTDFLDLPSVWELKSEEMIIKQLKKIKNFPHSLKIYLLGNGLVASGCRRILNVIDLPYLVLSRKETAEIENYLPKVDILVNATYWLPSEPHIVEKKHLKLMKKTAIICDISCEEHGAIETTLEKTWGNPTYEVDGILHFAVGNLPSALSHDASVHLSNMIIKYVKEIAKGNYNFTGLITKDGKYLYKLPTKK